MKMECFNKLETNWGSLYILFNDRKLLGIILPGQKYIPSVKYKHFKKHNLNWLEKIEKKMILYFSGKKVAFDLSCVDLSFCSEFKRKVYSTLSEVPFGSVISYKHLAKKAGYAHAYRAVGTAMASNRYPLIIPCHRVIKTNGDIGDFGYGRAYKIQMLKLEGSL